MKGRIRFHRIKLRISPPDVEINICKGCYHLRERTQDLLEQLRKTIGVTSGTVTLVLSLNKQRDAQ